MNTMQTEKNTELATSQASKPSAMIALANRCQVDASKLTSALKETVFKGAKDSELLALVVVANEYNLNPFTKEIYAFPAKGGGIVPIVSIDGWLNIINSHPQFDGMSVRFQGEGDGLECTVSMHRKDRNHPTEVTEYLAECRQSTKPWQEMPRRMLRHKAIIQCARVAFGFGGIYDEEEGKQAAEGMRNVTPPKAEIRETPIDPFQSQEVDTIDPKPQTEQTQPEPGPEPEPLEEPTKTDEPSLMKCRVVSVEEKQGEKQKRYIVTLDRYDTAERFQATTFSKTKAGIAEFHEGSDVMVEIKDAGKWGLALNQIEAFEKGKSE